MPTTIEPIRAPLTALDLAVAASGLAGVLVCLVWLTVFTLEAIAAMGGKL